MRGSNLSNFQKNIIVVAIVILAFASIGFSYYASFLGTISQVLLAIITLVVSGTLIQKIKKLKGSYGLYMIGGKKGIGTVDAISKRNKWFWNSMAIWGIILGFGFLAFPLLKGKIGRNTFAFGIISILAIMYFIIPCIGLPLQFINIPQIQSALGSAAMSCTPGISGLTNAGKVIYAGTVISGFSGYLVIALVYSGAAYFYSDILYIISTTSGHPQTSLLLNQIPGIAPIIPGIDIPLIAGIIALMIILTIHELSHGVLARISKVKLKQIGLLLIGVIPVGAFVEPDEKAVQKLSKEEQNAISAAGISSNFIAMAVFFALTFLMFIYIVPSIYTNNGVFIQAVVANSPAANASVLPGMKVLYWNGYKINNITEVDNAAQVDVPGYVVSLVASYNSTIHSYNITAAPVSGSSRGEIGVELYQSESIQKTAYASTMYFLYTVFALTFLLNFLVAIVNLLPIPGFDGYRLYKTNIKSTFFIRFVTALIVIALVLVALPWVFIAILH